MKNYDTFQKISMPCVYLASLEMKFGKDFYFQFFLSESLTQYISLLNLVHLKKKYLWPELEVLEALSKNIL